MSGERQTLTVEEAAEVLGIGRNSAYEAIKRGEIPALRLGRRLVVPRKALDRLLWNNNSETAVLDETEEAPGLRKEET